MLIQKRDPRWNYGGENWKLSRSKIESFLECPRCFYADNKLGIRKPSIPSFMINNAVDHQLKKEFDKYRTEGKKHPLQKENNIDAIPAKHEKIDTWRENFEGVQYFHEPTKMLITGAIDDLWINSNDEYIVVDYKATANSEPVKELNSQWHESYKRQMDIYQWLLRKNNLKVSKKSYFVYCTGIFEQEVFDKKIEFDIELIEYIGDDSWIEGVVFEIKDCLENKKIPNSKEDCEFCNWLRMRGEILN